MMMSNWIILLVVAAATCCAFFSGCSARSQLDPTVMNDIAACTGRYNVSRETLAEIRAEFLNRSGTIISSDELTEGGASAFAFGKVHGADAVAMYNTYVQCMNTRRQQSAPSASEEDRSPTANNRIGSLPHNAWIVQSPPPGSEQVGQEIRIEVDFSDATREGTMFDWTISWCNPTQIGGQNAPFFRFRVDQPTRCAVSLRYGVEDWGYSTHGPFWVNIEQ